MVQTSDPAISLSEAILQTFQKLARPAYINKVLSSENIYFSSEVLHSAWSSCNNVMADVEEWRE
jgi:hypothetical protein